MHVHRFLRLMIASVWLLNGIWCKLLGAVPRHEEIVARFFGTGYAHPITLAIGAAETLMGVWVLSAYRKRLNAILQIVVVLSMNALEAIYARDLLLWGAWNAVWAASFVVVVAVWERRRILNIKF